MTSTTKYVPGTRLAVLAGVVAMSGLALPACSPTYGTDRTANQQLVEDLGGILSLAPRRRSEPIDYKPRPALVKPETTTVLPPPQEDVTARAGPQWPESPEQRLARIRAEATEEGRSSVTVVPSASGRERAVDSEQLSAAEQREEFRRRRAMSQQGDPNTRRYLSEPPVAYRQPADTAPIGELGEDEWRKERDARRAAGETRGIRDIFRRR